jgi:hypothetical protein
VCGVVERGAPGRTVKALHDERSSGPGPAQDASRDPVAHPEARPGRGSPRLALWLQGAIGNARAGQALAILRQPDPNPAPPPPPAAQKAPLFNRVVDFVTPTATLGGVEVHASGRLLVSGQATVTDAALAAKSAAPRIADRATELIVAAFGATAPTGSGTHIEVSLGGRPLALDLASAPVGPAFQVTGHFTVAGGTLTVQGVEVASREMTLDATVWVVPPKPAPPKAGAPAAPPTTPPPAPAAPPPAPAAPPPAAGAPPTGTAVQPAPAVPAGPRDASVVTYAFAGKPARFKDTDKTGSRSGSVSLKSSFDDFAAKLPADAKAGALGFLTRPEQVLAFFQEMRSYFGSDDKTIAHFAAFRKARVKGATTILHEAAAARLEAVQAEIGEAEMPASGGIGWPRSECRLSGQAGLGNLHNLGLAVDYNAYQAPKIDDPRRRDLITLVTGRGPTASYPSTRGIDTRKTGEKATTGTDAEKAAIDADAAVTTWLDGVEAEATALGQASEDFRASLQGKADPKDPKSAVVDHGPELVALRARWHAAAKKSAADRATERAAVMAALPAVVQPWLDKLVAFRTTSQADLAKSGVDVATLPSDLEAVASAAVATDALRESAKQLLTAAAPKPPAATSPPGGTATPPALPKRQRAQIDALITRARTAVGEKGGAAITDDAAAIAELTRLGGLLEKRGIALLAHSRITRMNRLETALSDPTFMFGDAAKAVVDPSAAQLVGEGFFTLRGAPGAGKEAFSPAFVRSMLKHGFGHGAEWGTPDLMHFELRWKGPGQ